jgi:hypothetical protein
VPKAPAGPGILDHGSGSVHEARKVPAPAQSKGTDQAVVEVEEGAADRDPVLAVWNEDG